MPQQTPDQDPDGIDFDFDRSPADTAAPSSERAAPREESVPAHDEAVPPQQEPASAESQQRAPGSVAPAPPQATVAGRVWVAIVAAVVILVLLIIFIAENSQHVTISFLGAHGHISLGLAMLIAAVVGAVITLLVGTTRILQLRREVRRSGRRTRASR